MELVEVVCGRMVVQTSFGHEGMRERENYLGRVFCVVFHSCTCTQECCLSCFSWSVLMIECDNIRGSFSEVNKLQLGLHPGPNQTLNWMQCPYGGPIAEVDLCWFDLFPFGQTSLALDLVQVIKFCRILKEFSGVLLQIESRS